MGLARSETAEALIVLRNHARERRPVSLDRIIPFLPFDAMLTVVVGMAFSTIAIFRIDTRVHLRYQ